MFQLIFGFKILLKYDELSAIFESQLLNCFDKSLLFLFHIILALFLRSGGIKLFSSELRLLWSTSWCMILSVQRSEVSKLISCLELIFLLVTILELIIWVKYLDCESGSLLSNLPFISLLLHTSIYYFSLLLNIGLQFWDFLTVSLADNNEVSGLFGYWSCI